MYNLVYSLLKQSYRNLTQLLDQNSGLGHIQLLIPISRPEAAFSAMVELDLLHVSIVGFFITPIKIGMCEKVKLTEISNKQLATSVGHHSTPTRIKIAFRSIGWKLGFNTRTEYSSPQETSVALIYPHSFRAALRIHRPPVGSAMR